MRQFTSFVASSFAVGMLAVAACGGGSALDGGTTDSNTDDGTLPDGPGTPDAPGGDGDLVAPAHGFQIKSKEVIIQPGEEVTYCYYFRTPNTETMAIDRFVSHMTPGSHHLIMFTTAADVQAPGTMTTQGCGISGGGTNIPYWTYSAQTPEQDLQLPSDDGAGKPLAIEIKPNTPAYMQLHYLNATENPITVHATLNAESLATGAAFTKTAAYVTYNPNLNIPGPSTGHTESLSCNVPAGAKFWLMSTHSHKHSTHTDVKNGTEMTMESSDWEHPPAKSWMTPATFYSFAAKLTYECTYDNASGTAIHSGESAQYDEMCMASGYYFLPAGTAVPRICYGSTLLPAN